MAVIFTTKSYEAVIIKTFNDSSWVEIGCFFPAVRPKRQYSQAVTIKSIKEYLESQKFIYQLLRVAATLVCTHCSHRFAVGLCSV